MSIENKGRGRGLRSWAAICGLIVGGFCLAGCHSSSPTQQFADVPGGLAGSSAPATAPATTKSPPPPASVPVKSPAPAVAMMHNEGPEPEVLRVGDSLTITLTDTPTIIPVFDEKIKDDGTITLTLNQKFKADGKTRGELEKDIRDRYVPDYFRQMTVTVKHLESTRWYYVYGEVRSPNRQIYNSRITLLKAIASAGGFTDFANKKNVQLTRVDGRTQVIDCLKAQRKPTLDPEIYPGDTIHVRRRLW